MILDKKKCFFLFFTLLLSSFSSFATTEKKMIKVWTYYNFPPFVIDEKQKKGLHFDFVALLNQKFAEKYHFEGVKLPRRRIDLLLTMQSQKNSVNGIVAWVNPIWFKDKNRKTYFWTNTIFTDQNEVVSHRDRPLRYDNASSLIGLNLGGVFGHRYVNIDDLVKKDKITRHNVATEKHNLSKLLLKRIDVTIVPKSAMLYLLEDMNLIGKIHISSKAHQTYTRHLMIPKHHPKLAEDLSAFIKTLPTNEKWQNLLHDYNLEGLTY